MMAHEIISDPILILLKKAYPLVDFNIFDIDPKTGVSAVGGISHIRMSVTCVGGGGRAVNHPCIGKRPISWWQVASVCALLSSMASRGMGVVMVEKTESWVPVRMRRIFPKLHDFFRNPTASEIFSSALMTRNYIPTNLRERLRLWMAIRMKKRCPNPKWGWL